MNSRIFEASFYNCQATGEMPGSIQLEEPIERVFYNSRHRSGPGQAGGALGRMKTVQVVTVDQLLSHVDRLWLVVSTFLFFHIFPYFSIFFSVFWSQAPQIWIDLGGACPNWLIFKHLSHHCGWCVEIVGWAWVRKVWTIDSFFGWLNGQPGVDFIRFSSTSFWSIPAALRGAASSLQRFRPWLLLELDDGHEEEIRSALQNGHYECNSYLVDGRCP